MRTPAGALALITLAAVLLRIRSFSDSLNDDELATYFVVTGHGIGRLVEIVQSDQEITPPLYPILAHLTQGIGSSTDSLRWVPMLAGVGSIPLTFLLGIRTVGRRASLVAASVMALSPFLIFYSSEARPYSLMMVLCLGSTLALLQALDDSGTGWWLLYGALSCAAMYSHYTAAFVLFAQFAWALVTHRRAWRPLIVTNIAAAIGFAPWLTSYRADQDSPGAAIIGILQPFDLGTFKTDVLHWAVGHPTIDTSVRTMPGSVAVALIGAGLVIGSVAVATDLTSRTGWKPSLRSPAILVVILALATPVIAAAYSSVGVSVFLPRNLIASWPGLALTLGAIVTGPSRQWVRIAATGLLIAGFAIGAGRMLTADSQRPDYKGAAAFIESQGGREAVTVDLPGLSPGPLSQLDAAASPGQAVPKEPTILRLERGSRGAQLRAARPGGPGQFAQLPVATPGRIAAQAARRARGGEIFLVSPGSFTLAELRGEAGKPHARALLRATPVATFLRALPQRFEGVEKKTFPGFFGHGTLSVYVLRGDRGSK